MEVVIHFPRTMPPVVPGIVSAKTLRMRIGIMHDMPAPPVPKVLSITRRCFVCGAEGSFLSKDGNPREAQCPQCGASSRNSDVARAICAMLGQPTAGSMAASSAGLRSVRMFEAQTSGAIHDRLKTLPNYQCAEFLDGVEPGSVKNGIRCEDLRHLTYPDNSFDLVITQDVLEHVDEPSAAFAEIRRVLKPGGRHIFTVPYHPTKNTQTRAVRGRGGVDNLLLPVYHGDPVRENGCIVYTDFGADLTDRLDGLGFATNVFQYEEWFSPEEVTWIATAEDHLRYREELGTKGMLGYFRYNSPVFVSEKLALAFTGERFVPEAKGPMAYEHYHRYAFALELVHGKTVLDIASGEGFGAALLAQRAQIVFGVDVSVEAVTHATRRYRHIPNLQFTEGSCGKIPCGDASMDVVVSFETIEHISGQEAFLAEVRRVLKPDGILIISSPNKAVYSPGQKNEFHVRELHRREFEDLMRKTFPSVEIFGQRMTFSSLTWPLGEVAETPFTHYTEDGGLLRDGARPPFEPEYLLAVCSSVTLPIPHRASLLTSGDDMMMTDYHQRGVWGMRLDKELNERDAEIKKLRREMESAKDTLDVTGGNGDLASRKTLAGLCVSEGRIAEAVKIYQELLPANPNDVDILLALGRLCLSVRDTATAAIFIERVRSLDPANEALKQLVVEAERLIRRGWVAAPRLQSQRIDSVNAYKSYAATMPTAYPERMLSEKNLIGAGEKFTVPGYCHVCGKEVRFSVAHASGTNGNGTRVPNWREQLICPTCGLNNRMRASVHLLEELVRPSPAARIYVAEQTTPLYHALAARYAAVTGSEYLGTGVPLGAVSPKGIRNESLTQLTFPYNSLDCILTFDVFEHIPDYQAAFRECCRTLKPGGTLLFTAPFDQSAERNLVRAVVEPDGHVRHRLPPEYHGDPVNPEEGCLCYQVFGWGGLGELKGAGFSDAAAYVYWSKEYGYLGGEQFVFIAKKAAAPAVASSPGSGDVVFAPMSLWRTDAAFGKLMSQIPYTLVDRVRCFMLYQFAQQASRLEGEFAEIGVYKGGTAKLMAKTIEATGKVIHLFDTFEGMPETDPDKDHHLKGDFDDTSLAQVKKSLDGCGNVRFYPGYFPATAGPIKDLSFSLAHIDVDIYQSVRDCCDFFYPRMTRGGLMVFDDYGFESCPGAKAAVDEFFHDKPERPCYNITGQCLVTKL